ncbi:MAG: MFS transporter [Proteobacteria bacterium]|nr:MFS transporter [Pseudomonadota bacterium]
MRDTASTDETRPPVVDPAAARLRWLVLGLVFLAGALNYADRQIIALLKPVIEHDLGWSNADYAAVLQAFQLCNAAALIPAGWLIDRMGVRAGYVLGVGSWSLAAMAHGVAVTLAQFTGARALLGVTEATQAPAALKSVAAWFPLEERSAAMGFVNTAPNIGNVVAPLVVPALALAFGWRPAFVIVGGAGALWILLWLAVGRVAPLPAALAPSAKSSGSAGLSGRAWLDMLADRRTWAVAGAKFLSDQSWWFLLFWAPDFFHRRFGLTLGGVGGPLALTYLLAAGGAFAGGLAATALLRRGVRLGVARKAMLAVAFLVVSPIAAAQFAPGAWSAALILGVALAGHQAFSTNIFAMSADIFPPAVMGTAIGVASTMGTLGGMGILALAGWSLDHGHGYGPMFLSCTLGYPAALAWIHLMLPVIRPWTGPAPAEPATL